MSKVKHIGLATTIRDLALSIHSDNKSIVKFQAQLKLMEVSTASTVKAEMVDNKPKYSNNDKRNAETKARLASDEDYKHIVDKIETLIDKTQTDTIENSLNRRLFEIEMAHVKLG